MNDGEFPHGGVAVGLGTHNKKLGILEARVGFEPTNGGFADLSLRPLGYRAGVEKYSEIATHLSVVAKDTMPEGSEMARSFAAILLGTPISRLAVCTGPIGRLAYPGKRQNRFNAMPWEQPALPG